MEINGDILSREYHPDKFNCGHFFLWAWNKLFPDKAFAIPGGDQGFGLLSVKSNFKMVSKLEKYGVVTMHHRSFVPHIGIFFKGKVLHIRQNGVEYQPLSVVRIGYQEIRFYEYIE